MTRQEVARMLTLDEGKKQQVNIAQMNEVLRCLSKRMKGAQGWLIIKTLLASLAVLTVLSGCSATQMQTVADSLTGMERTLCAQAPAALLAATAAQATAAAVQQAKPGPDADKAVAAANLTVAALSQAQAFCHAKGY